MSRNRKRAGSPRRASTGPLAVLALALASAVAQAQMPATEPDAPEPACRFQVTVFGGAWNAIGTAYSYKKPSSTVEVGFGNAPAYGLAVGVDASRLLGIELSWMQSNPAHQVAGSPPVPIRTVILNDYEVDSLWYIRRHTFQVFGTLGVGGSSTGSSFGGANFLLVAGLGIKAFVSGHFAIRADVKWDHVYGNVGHPGDPAFCDSGGCYYYRGSWYSSLPVTAGLTFAF
jgi:hypothetical protein